MKFWGVLLNSFVVLFVAVGLTAYYAEVRPGLVASILAVVGFLASARPIPQYGLGRPVAVLLLVLAIFPVATISRNTAEEHQSELEELRAINPKKWLREVRGKIPESEWYKEAKLIDPELYVAEEQKRASAVQERAAENKRKTGALARENPEAFIILTDLSWEKVAFDSIMRVSVTIQNNQSFAVKDIEITCENSADSGTVVDSNVATVYKVFPAKTATRLINFDMGFIDKQATQSTCKATKAFAM